jgi:hypothetical protein
MQYILSNDDHFAHLTDLLKAPPPDSPRAILCSLPVWWCPWIHDIGKHVILLVTGRIYTLSFNSVILNDSPLPLYCSPPSLIRYHPSHPSLHSLLTVSPLLTLSLLHPLLTLTSHPFSLHYSPSPHPLLTISSHPFSLNYSPSPHPLLTLS